jgi:site-specific recombinase XerC
MAEVKIKLPFVHSFMVYGKMRHVFRRKGFPQKTIKGKAESPEFLEHYHQLLEQSGGEPRSAKIGNRAGTIDALAIAWYQHDDFTKGLAKATQAPWRRNFDRFREFKTPSGRRYGQNSIRTLPKKAIIDFLDAKDADGNGRTINAKRFALKAIRSFIRFAISQCELEKDPSEDVKVVSKTGPKSAGHMTWLEPQIAQYRERHPLGTMARVAIELLLNIAARREDAHSLSRRHLSLR